MESNNQYFPHYSQKDTPYEKPYQKIIDDIDRTLRKQRDELAGLKQTKTVVHFTDLEQTLLNALHTQFKYIVRDAGGQLFIYENEPYKIEEYWYAKGVGRCNTLPYNHLFGEIQWTNQKPIAFR